jgi:hypothetical protein
MKKVPRTIIKMNRPSTINRQEARAVIEQLKADRDAAMKAARRKEHAAASRAGASRS